MTTPESRRAFLTGAGGVVGTAVVVALPATAARAREGRRLRLLNTYVAGIGRYAPAGSTARLSTGEAVVLRREPENGYDTRAVSVWTAAGEKLGYVPRIDNQALANLMDAGLDPEARILSVAAGGGRPEVALEIDVILGA